MTRLWWQVRGRRAEGIEWLDRSVTARGAGGEGWLTEFRRLGQVRDGAADGGLMADLAVLDHEGFRAADLHPLVRDFYEHTGRWQMEAHIAWSRLFAPGGWFVERFFGRRVHQLAIPVTRTDEPKRLSSSVAVIVNDAGRQVATAWTRRLIPTGEYVYSGRYSTVRGPIDGQPLVQVTFPLEEGNVQVLLAPHVREGGSLLLASHAGGFGEPGAYAMVRDGRRGTWHAARFPLHEDIHVYVGEDGVLRTDHELRLWRATVVRLRYRLRVRDSVERPSG